MKTNLFLSAAIAFSLLSTAAMARNSECADYGICEPFGRKVATEEKQPLAAPPRITKRVGDFIDETPEESNERSSRGSN
jgi:hypothetical protein